MKSSLAGWKHVFSFTLIQTLKNRAFLISFFIFMGLSLFSMPLVSSIFSLGNEEAEQTSPIEKVFIYNNTPFSDEEVLPHLTQETMSHIEFAVTNEDFDSLSETVDKVLKTAVILSMTEDENGISLQFFVGKKSDVKEVHVQTVSAAITKELQAKRIQRLGITQEQDALLNGIINSQGVFVDEAGEVILEEDTSISMSEYWFIYGILFFVMMANVLASTQIATAVVTEKATRVVEYLLITVKPLALMIGKVLAMLFVTLMQMLSMVVLLFISNKVSASITGGTKGPLEQMLSQDIFGNLTIINLVLCFLLVMLGMVFYATLAGLVGATASKIEELNESLTLFTFTNIAGAYIGIGAAGTLMGAGINPFVIFAFLFPLSSPFILPGAILIGKASLPLIGIAILLELVFIILLFKFAAKVYETLILHNGNKIKIKELISFSKTV